jgi:hypothetical protein
VRHAPYRLHVDQPVARAVAPHRLAGDEANVRRASAGDPTLAQRRSEAIDVRGSSISLPSRAHHLVDAVGGW